MILPSGTSSSGDTQAAPPPTSGSKGVDAFHTSVGCLFMGCGVSLVFALLAFVVWLVRGRL